MREDWIEVKLGDLLKLKNGFAFKANNYIKEGIPVFRIGDINDWAVSSENAVKIAEDSVYDDYQVEQGDILIAMSGATTGKFGIYHSNEKAYQNQRVGNLKLYSENSLNKKFIFYLLYSLKRDIEREAYGGAQPNISGVKIEALNTKLAPLPIQRAIVSKIEALFSDLDNGIANFKTAQEQLKIYRQAVLEQGLTGVFTENFRNENPQLENSKDLYKKIQEEIDNSYKEACKIAKEKGKSKPKDQRKNKKAINVTSFLPEIPWEYYRLEDLTYLVTDGTHFTPKYQEQGVKFLSVKNVRPYLIKDEDIKYISEEEHKQLIERCKPENGDILYTKVGATYGYASKVKLDYEFSIFVSLCLIKPVYQFFLSEFLEYLMNSEIVFRQARQRVSGSGVPDLHLIEIRDFKVPLPSVEEQRVIIQEIESRISVCDKMEQSLAESIEKAEALRQSILKKAFEGKLLSEAEIEQCKQEADYEPASELLKKIQAEKLAKEQEKKKKPTAKKKSKK
ncbi:MAG: hypothetical protein EOM76_04920 [Sphingobacteriia bacterium]|nr:hypothetical protein [Sphingobacteriia bacterium]